MDRYTSNASVSVSDSRTVYVTETQNKGTMPMFLPTLRVTVWLICVVSAVCHRIVGLFRDSKKTRISLKFPLCFIADIWTNKI